MGVVFRNWEILEEKRLFEELTRIREAGFTCVLYDSESLLQNSSPKSKAGSFQLLQRVAYQAGIGLEAYAERQEFSASNCALTASSLAQSVYVAARALFDGNESASRTVSQVSPGFYRSCDSTPLAFTPGRMTRLALSLIAAGAQKIDLLRWNPARMSPVADEYEMLDMLGRVTPQSKVAGAICRAMARYGEELFESEAVVQAQVFMPNSRSTFSRSPQASPLFEGTSSHSSDPELGARGVTSAMMSRNLSWRFTNENQFLQEKTVAKILFVPEGAAMSTRLLARFQEFVDQGGRVILELPTSLSNDPENFLDTRAGTPFERLFGVSIANLLQESETPPDELGLPTGLPVAELVVTTAEVRRHLSSGLPGVTEKRFGNGSACLIAYSLSKRTAESEDWRYRVRLLTCLEDPTKLSPLPEWQCLECLAFRRETSVADHYFLLNDQPMDQACMLHFGRNYSEACNVLSEEPAPLDRRTLKIVVPALTGVWLRLVRSDQPLQTQPLPFRKPISEMEFSDEPFSDMSVNETQRSNSNCAPASEGEYATEVVYPGEIFELEAASAHCLETALQSGLEGEQHAGDDKQAAENEIDAGFFMKDYESEDHCQHKAEFVYGRDF